MNVAMHFVGVCVWSSVRGNFWWVVVSYRELAEMQLGSMCGTQLGD